MYWMPRLPIGRRVADPKARASVDPRTTREYAERERIARQRTVVQHWAAMRGIPSAPAPKRRRNKRPAWVRDREANGPARTLHADEIRALGFATSKVEG